MALVRSPSSLVLVSSFTCALVWTSGARAAEEDAPTEEEQIAYEQADMAKHRLTFNVGVGFPELPRLGVDFLASPWASFGAQVSVFPFFPTASVNVNVFLSGREGFRPFVSAGTFSYVNADTGGTGVCPALRVGFENRGHGGESFRAEVGGAVNTGPLKGAAVIPIVAISRGFALF